MLDKLDDILQECHVTLFHDDVGEEHDLSVAMPEKAEAMRMALSGYLSDVRAPRWQEGITWKGKPLAEFDSVH